MRLRTKLPSIAAPSGEHLPVPLVLIAAASVLLERRRRHRYEPTARLPRSACPND